MADSCGNCRFYRPDHHRNQWDDETGNCARYPPTPVTSVSSYETSIYDGKRLGTRSSTGSSLPTVDPGFLCGEWQKGDPLPVIDHDRPPTCTGDDHVWATIDGKRAPCCACGVEYEEYIRNMVAKGNKPDSCSASLDGHTHCGREPGHTGPHASGPLHEGSVRWADVGSDTSPRARSKGENGP